MLGFRFYKTVIMDGSDKKKVKEITSIFEMIQNRRFSRIKAKPIDKDHPTMLVLTTLMSAQRYHDTRRIINQAYPGLCIFDAKNVI